MDDAMDGPAHERDAANQGHDDHGHMDPPTPDESDAPDAPENPLIQPPDEPWTKQ